MPSLISQSFPPASKYKESDIVDLTGRVAIVTGANTGIGYECARALLTANAKVYLACRSEDKANAALASLETATGKKAEFLQLDLSSVKSCQAAATVIVAKEPLVHLLFNSAGVMMPALGSLSQDGLDLQWGTNCVGHYAFTEGILPSLKAAAAATKPGLVRIITTSSSAHIFAVKGGVDLEDQTLGGKKGGMELYGQSKLANIIQSNYWAEKLRSDGIICISLNPGNINSDLARSMNPVARFFLKLFLHPVALGAITQLYAGISEEVTMADSGGYFVPWARKDKAAREETRDPEFCAKVMELMEAQVQVQKYA